MMNLTQLAEQFEHLEVLVANIKKLCSLGNIPDITTLELGSNCEEMINQLDLVMNEIRDRCMKFIQKNIKICSRKKNHLRNEAL